MSSRQCVRLVCPVAARAFSTSIQQAAAEGFSRNAAVYERGRPEYAQDAVAHIGNKLQETLERATPAGQQPFVVDLAGGTGKFTRLLLPFREKTPFRLAAVEPVKEMREQAALVLGDSVEQMEGTAEEIPLPDASVDAVFVAQAYHWFNFVRARNEIRRVLRPNGLLALIWNRHIVTPDCPEQQLITEVCEPREKDTPKYYKCPWKHAFEITPRQPRTGFTPLEYKTFPHVQRGDTNTVIDRVLSVSFMAALPKSEQDEVRTHMQKRLAEIAVIRPRDPATGEPIFELQYATDVFTTSKIAS